MAFEHPSGFAGAYDRTAAKPDYTGLVFRDGKLLQGAELNEMQSLADQRFGRVGNLTARDGDRISGCDLVKDGGTVTLKAGEVFLRGDVRAVAERVFTTLPLVGEVTVGVRIITTYMSEVDDPELKGLHPGSRSQGEAGAARRRETVSWGYAGDGEAGDLFSVYQMRDGTVFDQREPAILSGITQQIANYDGDAHGSYIVEGCLVTPLGRIDGSQHFSIEAGTGNIAGFKRERFEALRHVELENFDTQTITDETHVLTLSPCTITLSHGPVDQVTSVTVEKQVVENVVKGVTGSINNLQHSTTTNIIDVRVGGTVYLSPTSWIKVGDGISWAPAGAEPAQGATVAITYRYRDPVTPDAVTATTVTVSGHVTGGEAIVDYRFKLPRTDLLCLDEDGGSAYVKGESSQHNPKPPLCPDRLLALAEIANSWVGAPSVRNNGIRRYTFAQIDRMYNRLLDVLDLATQTRLNADIDRRYTASKNDTFADPFDNDALRDAGEAQTMALFAGRGQGRIIASLTLLANPSPVLLDYTDEVVIGQDIVTGCLKINGFANFTPLPATLRLKPAVDRWVEHQTVFSSDITRQFTEGGSDASRTVSDTTDVIDTRSENIRFMRSLPVQFTVTGFGAGEILSDLTLDGINVKPAGVQTADGSGIVTGTLVVPANTIVAGTKPVKATGAGGGKAQARFTAEGILETAVVQRTLTIINTDNNQGGGNNLGGVNNQDPLAQSFVLKASRFVTGVDVTFCAKGNVAKAVEVDLRETTGHLPLGRTLTQKRLAMGPVALNVRTPVNFPFPVFLPKDKVFANVFKTADNIHALAIASLGKFDATNQKWMSRQPYTTGVLATGSVDGAWTINQTSDLAFRVRAAKFAPTSKIVDLGTFPVTNASDLMVRASVQLPTKSCSCVFELTLPSGVKRKLRAGQNWQLDSYVTGNVNVKALLAGNVHESPLLFEDALLVAGELQATATYVSRALSFGANVGLSVLFMHRLPPGSAILVQHDLADGNFQAVPLVSTKLLNDGWSESKYRKPTLTATQGRVKLTLSVTPAARGVISDFRSWSEA